jgi:hypothetical protein
MTLDDLQTALEGLSTERLERLVDRLERDPDITVTVGAWRPQCPMVIAGFDPVHATANEPEHCFAFVWDHFARPEQRHWIPLRSVGGTARRSDVQILLRRANAVLAYRSARERPRCERGDQARRSSPGRRSKA